MPDLYMDVDIALASVPVNILPLVDSGDFVTIEDAVVYNQAGLALFWNFTTTGGVTTVTAVTPTSGDDHDWTDFSTSGMYGIEIPASGGDVNNDTEGFGYFTGVATGILPWRGPTIGIRSAVINNAFMDDDSLSTTLELGLLYDGVITTSTTESEYIMATAFAHNDAWNDKICTVQDVSGNVTIAGYISDCVQSTNTLHVVMDGASSPAPPFTIEDGVDIVRIYNVDHAGKAVVNFDPPTRAEATSDADSILSKLRNYVRVLARKDSAILTDQSTEVAAINADDGAGSGAFSNATDSHEALGEATTAPDNAGIAAIQAQTDQLSFTDSEVDANIKSVIGDPVKASSSKTTNWGGTP